MCFSDLKKKSILVFLHNVISVFQLIVESIHQTVAVSDLDYIIVLINQLVETFRVNPPTAIKLSEKASGRRQPSRQHKSGA